MSQQTLDLRKSVQIARRHKFLVGIVTVLGLLAGAGYAFLNPPVLTSTALVVLPQAAAQSAQAAAASGPDSAGSTGYMATQAVIAGSDPVLSAALPRIKPATSLPRLQRGIEVKSVTDSILSISASGATAAQAEDAANAVANSYVSYVASSRAGRVQANVLQSAMTGTRTSPLKQQILYGLLGALAGILVGFITALAISREDRRLRERDEIANAIGVPVLASFPVAHPSDAAAWTKLLDDYQPAVVHAWRMRRLLQQLGTSDIMSGNEVADDRCSLTILSLSSDRGALALGPQLAVFAASQGIPTTLVLGPQQDPDVTATLRTACGASAPVSSTRSRQLRVTVNSDGDSRRPAAGTFTVVVAAVDSRAPQVPSMMRTTMTLLGVSAGMVTAEQLARLAVNAAANGREVNGILVADPEVSDRTTGRVPQLARPARRRQPTRVSDGMAMEIQR